MQNVDLEFFRNKKVLLTGHTGFKGTWMSKILCDAGACLIGYSRGSHKDISLFELSGVKDRMTHIVGNVQDLGHLKQVFQEYQPEIVIHMAAQPIVRESYADPFYTYETNVMGTVNIMECIRLNPCVKSCLNVTTDKVYLNREWVWGYREDEPLDGYDPYSNSKSCSELVTHSYVSSFFTDRDVAVSTARAGNVIGGGDFAKDRIIPDCVRAVQSGKIMGVRNPYSTRPYQHVLEPLFAYLMIVQKQYENKSFAGWYNVGPDECDCITTGELVSLFREKWGEDFMWENQAEANAPHEANFLKLDCSKIKSVFGWKPTWHMDMTMEKIVDWTRVWLASGDIPAEMEREILTFMNR
ncbi:MAG: CDP-glucose 4,6-dehydratase [Oscillospiraceae bacterium]|nr:CDP-glucose 4,6-dehydratase [Oscillospiraceae bacterium]